MIEPTAMAGLGGDSERATCGGRHRRGVAPLTGREAEYARLGAIIARVASGDAAVVVLCGLAGIGKTRLAHETLQTAEAAGFATCVGHCDATGDAAYAPFVQAFGDLVRDTTSVRRMRLVGDLPQLGLLIGGPGLAPPEPLGDPALEHARLTEGFVRLVDRLAHDQPLALLIDDVHAADAATSALLGRLLTAVADRPVLFVCTARSDEPGTDRVDALVAGLTGTIS